MNQNTMISIIIPVYNSEKYILNTLNSVKEQTFTDYEIIIVDDCGTDNSMNLIEEFKNNNSNININIISNITNKGISQSRNIGINNSNGKYIMFLDHDDMLELECLKTLYDYAENYNADVVHTHSHYENRKNGNKEIVTIEYGDYFGKRKPAWTLSNDIDDRIKKYTTNSLDWNVWGKLFKKEFLTKYKISFTEIKLTEDLLFVLQCVLCHECTYVLIPEVIYFYRIYEESTLNKMKKQDNYLEILIDIQIKGLRALSNFIRKYKLDFQNSKMLIDWYFNTLLGPSADIPRKITYKEEYFKTLLNVFSKYFDDDNIFVSCLYNFANVTDNVKPISLNI